MTHGSLYSGIGGWLLAAQWAGIENVFTCEIEDFPNKVLDKHFPNTDRHYDIKETDFTKYAGRIDILSTLDPCQPFSFAGKRGGTTDDRFLWPFTIEAIRTIKPKFVVFENVPGFISMAFETVASDLEAEGYTVESFIIPACSVGAWHRRDRLWVIGYSSSCTHPNISGLHRAKINEQGEVELRNKQNGKSGSICQNVSDTNNPGDRTSRHGAERKGKERTQERKDGSFSESCGYGQDVSNTDSIRQDTSLGKQTKEDRAGGGWCSDSTAGSGKGTRREGTTESGLGGMVDGLPSWMDYFGTEPDIPRVAKGKKDRVNRLKALGNSIYPPVAYLIFEAIKNAEAHQDIP